MCLALRAVRGRYQTSGTSGNEPCLGTVLQVGPPSLVGAGTPEADLQELNVPEWCICPTR